MIDRMEYDDVDAEMEYDDAAAMALHMSVNGSGPVSLSGFNSCSEPDTFQQAFLPSFHVQPDDFASILRNVGQSIGSMPLSDQSMDESCPTSEGLIQWIDGLGDPSAATSSDGEIYHQVSYGLVSPVLSIPPTSTNVSAPSIIQPTFASVALEERAGTAYSGNSEDRQFAISVKRRKIGG